MQNFHESPFRHRIAQRSGWRVPARFVGSPRVFTPCAPSRRMDGVEGVIPIVRRPVPDRMAVGRSLRSVTSSASASKRGSQRTRCA